MASHRAARIRCRMVGNGVGAMSQFARGKKKCSACHGFGVVMGKDCETKPCWKCNGSGETDE